MIGSSVSSTPNKHFICVDCGRDLGGYYDRLRGKAPDVMVDIKGNVRCVKCMDKHWDTPPEDLRPPASLTPPKSAPENKVKHVQLVKHSFIPDHWNIFVKFEDGVYNWHLTEREAFDFIMYCLMCQDLQVDTEWGGWKEPMIFIRLKNYQLIDWGQSSWNHSLQPGPNQYSVYIGKTRTGWAYTVKNLSYAQVVNCLRVFYTDEQFKETTPLTTQLARLHVERANNDNKE